MVREGTRVQYEVRAADNSKDMESLNVMEVRADDNEYRALKIMSEWVCHIM